MKSSFLSVLPFLFGRSDELYYIPIPDRPNGTTTYNKRSNAMNIHHGKERGNGEAMSKVPKVYTSWRLGRTNLTSRIRRSSKMGKIMFGQQTDTTGVAELD